MHRSAYPLLLATTLFWAGNAVAGKLAVGHVSPMLLTELRWLVTMMVLAVLGRRRLAADWPLLRPRLGLLLFLGLLGFTVFSVAMYCALLYTSATNVSIEQGGMPVFVFAASFMLFRTRATAGQLLGFLLSFAGVLVTATHGEMRRLLHLDVNFGDALMLLAVVAYGLYTAALRLRPQVHWMSLMTVLCLGATLGAIPFVVAEAAAGALIVPDAAGLAIVVYVAAFPSLIGQAFYIRAVSLIGANRAGLFINFLPLWGALLAVLVLGETFQPYHALALALVLAGVVLAESSGRRLAAAGS
ncbi:DMT family transporter [Mesorhizobium sp. SP-1A]|uniref:DMT family transporter n=1 Tax=Mesorhizobium sp. SP-1A TaxID=3077840 RepID=UPI0028F6CE7D|nr:DMT family transporter [Mesorhizobium sp. SP-1A]